MGDSLPVWAVVKRSYGYVWRRRGLLLAPFMLVLLAQIVLNLVSPYIAGLLPRSPLLNALFQFGWALLIQLFYMSFSVGLHRTVLLEEVRTGASFLRWDRYLWNYFKACLILLATIAGVVAIVATAATLMYGGAMAMMLFMRLISGIPYFPLIIAIVFLLLMLKIGLGFPAAALGYKGVFTLSWWITKDNLLRLLAVFILTYLPFLLVSLLSLLSLIPLFKGAIHGVLPPAGMNLWLLAWGLFATLIGALSLTVLTVATSLSFFFLFKANDFEAA